MMGDDTRPEEGGPSVDLETITLSSVPQRRRDLDDRGVDAHQVYSMEEIFRIYQLLHRP